MIRVLALYSQCKQQFDISAASVTDCVAAKHLAYVLKTLLGLEAIIKLAIMAYINVAQDSEILFNPHKTKPDISTQLLLSALSRKVLLYVERRTLERCSFLWEPWTGELNEEVLDLSDSSIGPSRWCMGLYLWL